MKVNGDWGCLGVFKALALLREDETWGIGSDRGTEYKGTSGCPQGYVGFKSNLHLHKLGEMVNI